MQELTHMATARNILEFTDDLVEAITGVSSNDRAGLIKKVKMGLPFATVIKLEEAYRVNRNEISKLISISSVTLNRRQKDGILRIDESDRVLRFAQLKNETLAMMQGDDEAAVEWLRAPISILGSESPQDHAITELGAAEVHELIGRMQHGVFS
jgi:putative toxin-antitoxin system antitoxin component (TIGR02293 family)